jgi:hypothetical protein
MCHCLLSLHHAGNCSESGCCAVVFSICVITGLLADKSYQSAELLNAVELSAFMPAVAVELGCIHATTHTAAAHVPRVADSVSYRSSPTGCASS